MYQSPDFDPPVSDTPSDRMRGGATTNNIGTSAAVGAPHLRPAASAPAATGGGGVKLLAAALGLALAGGVAAVGGFLLGGSDGGNDATAPMVTPPMDRSIMEVDLVGTTFYAGYSEPVELLPESGYGQQPPSPLPHSVSGEPRYGDFDRDNDLDVAQLVVPHAGGGTPSLYVWLWDDGDIVQIPHPAAVGEDCGDHITGFEVVDHRIHVAATGGWSCDGAFEPVEFGFTVVMRDGFPVQVAPGFGSPYQCTDGRHEVIAEPAEATLYVAASTDSPQIDPADVSRIEVLFRGTGWGPDWRLARITGHDGVTNCAWVDFPEA